MVVGDLADLPDELLAVALVGNALLVEINEQFFLLLFLLLLHNLLEFFLFQEYLVI